jgi:hypothetical protein
MRWGGQGECGAGRAEGGREACHRRLNQRVVPPVNTAASLVDSPCVQCGSRRFPVRV